MLIFSQLPIRKTIRYIFFVLILGWILMTIILIYQYIMFSTVATKEQWWTIVQWVVWATSYLPYVQSFDAPFAYGNLLFDSCLTYNWIGNIYSLSPNFCDIKTTDNKIYTIRLTTDKRRSDNVPLTIKDLFFTYNEVIKNNKRKLSSVESYKDIIVAMLPDNTIRITFPLDSIDNKLLFTSPVLPQHILWDKTLEYYKTIFWVNPVVSSCTNILSQKNDQSSLVFDMTRCGKPIDFYQVKTFATQVLMDQYIKTSKINIIDFFYEGFPTSWYISYPVTTNSYLSLFFNTKSQKISPALRKSIAWLITDKITIGTGMLSFLVNDTYVFPSIWWTGQDIYTQMSRLWSSSNNTQSITQQSLQDINVSKLPWELLIKWRNKSSVYYIENTSIPNNLKITFESIYDRMTIASNDSKEIPINIIDKVKRIWFFDISKDPVLKEWLNKYVIRWYRNNQPRILLRLDIYLIKAQESVIQTWVNGPIDPTKQLTLISLNTPNHTKIIKEIKKIFDEIWLWNQLNVIVYDKQSEFEGKLLSKDYDMVLRVFNRGIKRDASNLFMTEQSLINPSQYTNTQLASYIKQYLNANTDNERASIKRELDTLYLNAIPLVLLWRIQSSIEIRDSYEVNWSWAVNEWHIMNYLIQWISLNRTSIRIDREKVLSLKNLLQFINTLRWILSNPK